MAEVIKLMEMALQIERAATLTLMVIGGAIVYVLVYKIPPMIASTLESVSKSLERISVTMAELVMSSTRICSDTNAHNTVLTIHHENALAIKNTIDVIEGKIDKNNDTLFRIETTLANRPCIK